ncbi:unnamed protein product [Soboliphyme baturini]|uniref:40S ribosomal protein S8 n=1 Tax=Soboliphyme baturini TaxID=241478 RepID=A0A183IVV3_9BILA|nr:unnamed protein product [Soboliphyme baturini]
MGISRDHWHKRRNTGGKRKPPHKKRKFELGRPPALTKVIRARLKSLRGGNKKFRALRLETGNFSWGSEGVSRKTRIIDVVYNASNNELVRTKTLVKGAIVLIDATPFRQWYEMHYTAQEEELFSDKKSKNSQKKYEERQKSAKVDPHLEEQFQSGRVLASISSRPGQVGRADGYILEGKEMDFYIKKIKAKKTK